MGLGNGVISLVSLQYLVAELYDINTDVPIYVISAIRTSVLHPTQGIMQSGQKPESIIAITYLAQNSKEHTLLVENQSLGLYAC